MTMESQTKDSEKAPNHEGKKRCRQDCVMFGVGIAFIAVLMAAVFVLGYWRGWDAPSGYSHNTSLTSKDRFLPEPTENDPYWYVRGRSGRPGLSGVWYYWRNKPEAATVATRVFVWLMYALHQISIWVLVYLAQVNQIQTKQPKVSNNLNKYNWISFGLNAFFHVMHLVKTHVTYDGLAPDVHIVSSQCSVIMLTMVILLLEYNERGFFLGWPVKKYHKGKISRKLTLSHKPVYYVRKYHGYAFSWASIYTFWYHPMENTYGHALGFVHTWILMLQGSLMFTKVHVNRWWRLVLESWVLLHGSLVAVQTGNPDLARSLWPMFFFGFLWVFLFNQIYILEFWYKLPDWVRVFPPAIYVAVTLGGYSAIPDAQGRYWVRIQEIFRIPAAYYISFILMWAFMLLCVFIDKKIYATKQSSDVSSATKIGHLVISLLLFIFMVAISIALEVTVAPISMFVLMGLLVIIFSLLSGLAFILLSHAMPIYKLQVRPELGSHYSEDSGDASSLPEKVADPSQPQKMADTTYNGSVANGMPQISVGTQSSKL